MHCTIITKFLLEIKADLYSFKINERSRFAAVSMKIFLYMVWMKKRRECKGFHVKRLVKKIVVQKRIWYRSENGKGEFPYEISQNIRATTIPGQWIQASDGRWWYRHSDGTYTVNSWEYINGKWYHFDINGWMQTGWIILDYWYYLGTDGAMVTGWAYIENYWYYFNTLGAMQTGWQEIDGNWYYLMANGKMVAGKWVKLSYPGIYDDKQYFNYFNSSGVFMTDSDAEGCIHGYNTITYNEYKYSDPINDVKYYNGCASVEQKRQVGISIIRWSNDIITLNQASLAINANIIFVDGAFSDPNVLASTVYFCNNKYVTRPTSNWNAIQIIVDADQETISAGTLTHELGHVFGLSHRITNPNSIMCQLRWGRRVETVQAVDLDVIRHLYQ